MRTVCEYCGDHDERRYCMKSAIDSNERSAIVKCDFQYDGDTVSAGSDGDTVSAGSDGDGVSAGSDGDGVSAGSDGDGVGGGTNVGDRDYVVEAIVVMVTMVRIVTLVMR